MLTFGTDERQGSSLIFVNSASSKGGSVSLISDSSSILTTSSSLLSNNCCEDFCSFYSGPSDSVILAFGESDESCGSIAYDSGIDSYSGYSGGNESCGSIASASFSSGVSTGGCCSYSC